MQYQAQSRHYRQHYPDAAWSIVTAAGEAAGRLIVARSVQEILIMDIALLPRYRSVGIGGILARRLLTEAEEAKIPLRCYVEQTNRVPIRVDIAHILMERKCATSPH